VCSTVTRPFSDFPSLFPITGSSLRKSANPGTATHRGQAVRRILGRRAGFEPDTSGYQSDALPMSYHISQVPVVLVPCVRVARVHLRTQ
jgi:hypothetical protein